jgi:hypothetical protein
MSKFIDISISNGGFISISDTASGTSITATSITLHKSLLIPANTFNASNGIQFVTIQGMVSKLGTSGQFTPYLYINTSSTLTSAQLIGTGSANATNTRSAMISRRCEIDGIDGSLNHVGTTSTNNDILLNTTGARASILVDWSVDQWIILAASRIASGDSTTGEWLRITTF